MVDDFGIDTDQMKKIAKAIKDNNDDLERETNKLMGKLDDAYLNFPPGVANLAQESQISVNAVFKRVRTENSRISQILKAIADAVEDQEKKLVQAFTPSSSAHSTPPNHK